ncbi:MAG: response regulator [Deltaproteobacteria bacterium]|nr:response regulator [Deltaproteobacteria bacterium]
MSNICILFVDDEEDIRISFRDRFEDQFEVILACDGQDALEKLKQENKIDVVVTDIRMPNMDGLEMIRLAREVDPDMGFIVVSGHGDTDDVITALRLGARNFIRKPYSFAELEENISLEAGRYKIIREERTRREREQATEQFLVSVDSMEFRLPTRLEWITPVSFRLVQMLEAVGLCDEHNRFNIALALIEIITNAVEHGNMGLTSEEKRQLKSEGEQLYLDELTRRAEIDEIKEKTVSIKASVNRERAEITVSDQGLGFDYTDLPDPTDPENLFLPSGRGILLARTFLNDVIYSGRGNTVTLVKLQGEPAN